MAQRHQIKQRRGAPQARSRYLREKHQFRPHRAFGRRRCCLNRRFHCPYRRLHNPVPGICFLGRVYYLARASHTLPGMPLDACHSHFLLIGLRSILRVSVGFVLCSAPGRKRKGDHSMKNVSKFAMWLLVFAAAALAGCEESYHEKEERYVLIAAYVNLPYWQEADAGLRDVTKEMGLGVKGEIDGPTSYDPKAEVDAFQKAVSSHPAGILVSVASPEMFQAPIAAASALHRVDMTGKIAIVSFDKDPETLDWIDRGGINATVVQKPYVMAYYGVKFLDDLHHNAVHDFKDWRTAPAAPLPAWVDTGTAIVDKTNLAAFREALAAHPKPL